MSTEQDPVLVRRGETVRATANALHFGTLAASGFLTYRTVKKNKVASAIVAALVVEGIVFFKDGGFGRGGTPSTWNKIANSIVS